MHPIVLGRSCNAKQRHVAHLRSESAHTSRGRDQLHAYARMLRIGDDGGGERVGSSKWNSRSRHGTKVRGHVTSDVPSARESGWRWASVARAAGSRESAGESGWGDVVAGKHVVRTVERQAEVSYKYLAE